MTRIKTLSKILKIKDCRKDELEAEVKKVHELIKVEQVLLDALEKTYSETVRKYEKRQQDATVSAHEFELFSNYFSRLYENMEQQKKTIIERIEQLNEIQQALVEAYRDKKLLEKLQTKILKELTKEQDLNAQKESDYLYLTRREENND